MQCMLCVHAVSGAALHGRYRTAAKFLTCWLQASVAGVRIRRHTCWCKVPQEQLPSQCVLCVHAVSAAAMLQTCRTAAEERACWLHASAAGVTGKRPHQQVHSAARAVADYSTHQDLQQSVG